MFAGVGKKLNQQFEAKDDDEAIEEAREFQRTTGIPVNFITRLDVSGVEVIVHRFS